MEGTTPGDPAAMAIYDTAIVSVVLMLTEKVCKETIIPSQKHTLMISSLLHRSINLRNGGMRFVVLVQNLDIFRKELNHG